MQHRPTSLMLFAAGRGTRMGALTAERPKPLIEVAGKPLIDHALDPAFSAGIETIVANLHYMPDALAAHLAPKGVALSLEADQLLDTGGGLKRALPLLGQGPVFTMNCDAVWTGGNPFAELSAAWQPDKMDALLLLVPHDAARGHKGPGSFVPDDSGRLARGSGLVYAGAQIIRTEMVRDSEEDVFGLNVVWDRMIDRGRLFGAVHNGGWCDVGHPGGIAEAEAMLTESRDV